jgi:molecular chaperone DnaJ
LRIAEGHDCPGKNVRYMWRRPMTKRDYYEVLGVERTCDAPTMKSAFRKLAMQYHPDRNAEDGAEEKFKEASEAYEVLSDPDKRARYDQFGHRGVEGFGGGAAGFGGNVNINDIFGEIFGDIFGQRGRQRQARNRGADLRYNLEISFEEAAFGAEVTVKIPRPKRCDVCDGTGSKTKQTRQCPTCGGAGEVRFTQGFFAVSRACSQCNGSGTIVADPCKNCKGSGKLESETSLQVKIPGGVDAGTRVRLAGEGEIGEHGGPPGDLYVVVHVKEHPLFVREEYEVLCEVPISFTQDGKVKMKIPQGTQSGKVFRLKGKGIPHLHGAGRGDQHVRVTVETPTELNSEQREILENFARACGEGVNPQSKSFFEQVKKLFG